MFGFKPLIYYDAHGKFGQQALYTFHNKKLSFSLPQSYFENPVTFPVVIDPVVYGAVDTGFFALPNQTNYKFSFISSGSCDVLLSDTVPGRSELLKTLIDLEYRTGESLCGVWPNTSSCIWTNVIQEVENVDCGTSTGPLSCDTSNLPIWIGACTTDSNKVPGTSAIQFLNLLNCYNPQCDDHILPFVLKNYENYCGSTCDTLCAIGQFFRITIEACRIEASIAADKLQICAGEPVVLTASSNCGVPPYHYTWYLPSGDTTTGNPITVYPEQTSLYQAIAYDTCALDPWITNDVTINVLQSPPSDAGPDFQLCEGGVVTLGGNPTTSNAQIQWYSESGSNYASWLSSSTQFNPILSVPSGLTDTFFMVARAVNPLCFRNDTMWVFSHPNPEVLIDSLITPICAGQQTNISVIGNYVSYLWNTGAQSPNLIVTDTGSYYLIATDSNGCKDSSNTVQVFEVTVPVLEAFPDTTINFGDSVVLYTNPLMNSLVWDSFYWFSSSQFNCTFCVNPIVYPEDETSFTIVGFSNGCEVRDSVLIRVILPTHYFIPNVFTPNGDGNNETFYVSHQSGVEVKSFKIFNRWGEKVHDALIPWDGTYKGKLSPPGVYVYYTDLQLQNKEEAIHRKGSITLVR